MVKHYGLGRREEKSKLRAAGKMARAIADEYLEKHPVSPGLFSTGHSNLTKIDLAKRLHASAAELVSVLQKDRLPSDAERRQAYLNFISTMNEVSKKPHIFSSSLELTKIMDAVCSSIGGILYRKNGQDLVAQIKDNLDDHLKFVEQVFARQFPQEQQLQNNETSVPRGGL